MQVPKLRFKEFTDEWKTKKIEDICELLKGGNLSKNDLSIDGTPCILYGELYTKYNEIINNVISKTKVNNLTYGKKNDILMPSSGETAIDIATTSCLQCDNIALGGDINVLRPYKDNGIFISYQLNGKNKLKIARLSQGIQVVHMYNDILKDISINLPSLEEQNKIANFLSLVDRKLELQQKLLDNLNLYKRGLLLEIFVRGGGSSRLNINYSNWKHIKLESLTEYYTSNLTFQSLIEYNTGNFKVYDLNGVCSYIDTYQFDFPYISIAKDGSVGRIQLCEKKSSIIGTLGVLKCINCNLTYLYYYLQTIDFKKYIVGTSIPHIYYKDYKNQLILCPPLEEQNRIADLFTSLDSKIDYETKNLESLKQFKNGLLQQMFI